MILIEITIPTFVVDSEDNVGVSGHEGLVGNYVVILVPLILPYHHIFMVDWLDALQNLHISRKVKQVLALR